MSILEKDSLSLLAEALDKLESGFLNLPSFESEPLNKKDMKNIITDVAKKLHNNYPYFHPYYAGQMIKPPHPIAKAAYILAMWINPNNHALDGGRASSEMEKEAVAEISKMFGWDSHLGHLTSAGTTANLEALWVAGQINPQKKIAASSQAHYTHNRISKVLGLNFVSIPSNNLGQMNIDALKNILQKEDIGMVVATLGTTATGSVDQLDEILKLKNEHNFRVHVDGAYGGYFVLANNLKEHTKKTFDLIPEVDSIVVDPHKHGMQPYGCGSILFKDPSVGRFYKHDSPYTYFSSAELHLGEISLECSRAGASAVALWATQKLLPLVKDGEFSNLLSKGRNSALKFFDKLKNDDRFIVSFEPELDIVVWLVKSKSISQSSILSKKIFEEAEKSHLHLALAELPVEFFNFVDSDIKTDAPTVKALRSVLMKPEHDNYIDKIFDLLCSVTDKVKSKI
jgi:glutamate/tyrosine decarboxylase-like PLP-dependent enzyme